MNKLLEIVFNEKMWGWMFEEGLKTAIVTIVGIGVAVGTRAVIEKIEVKKEEMRGPVGFMRYR